MKKCYLTSIGCRTNQEEIRSLAAGLRSVGFAVTDDIADADIVIVNTCSVTAHTESKTRRYIRSVPRSAPSADILVTGCFAQQHGSALLEYPNVKWVVGNTDKHRIPSIVGDNGDAGTSHNKGGMCPPNPDEYKHTRFSVKIQEGCDYRCSYCIVPSLRGPSRSASRGMLIDVFKSAIDKGYKEIVLTGTHIGQYGGGGALEPLLEDFLAIGGCCRIRLSSLDPRDLTDSLIALVGGGGRVCDHLHVSVQSLCAGVLARMGRPSGGVDALISRLRGYREKYPGAGLGGDFIVGHPGETDEMFEETLRAVEAVGFTYGHVFRYSARRGTASYDMPDRVPESVKKKRGEALRGVLQKSREKYLSSLAGSALYIIVENENPIRGVGGNYIRVEVPDSRAPKNTLARVILTGDIRNGYSIGSLPTQP